MTSPVVLLSIQIEMLLIIVTSRLEKRHKVSYYLSFSFTGNVYVKKSPWCLKLMLVRGVFYVFICDCCFGTMIENNIEQK